MDMVHDFLTIMYTNRADFVFTVSRDFVRSIQTPLLIAPDDVPAHPYKVAMEVASLAPNAEVTIYPWKDSPEHIDEVVERSEEHTSELQSPDHLVCRLLLEKKTADQPVPSYREASCHSRELALPQSSPARQKPRARIYSHRDVSSYAQTKSYARRSHLLKPT